MDAVIIAAGYGSRLASLSPSKPLTPVAGVPLIEIAARQCKAAGVTRIVVVTGHEADAVEQFLQQCAIRLDMPIEPVRIDDWSRPNGWSVIAGAAACTGPFLLLMADHMFDAAILARLAGEGGPDRDVTLAIDRRIDNPLVDPDDATWVQTDSAGRITAIGKTIAQFDAVDCGAFLATQALAEAIRTSIAAGKSGSLSDGMQVLADRGRAATMDVRGAWWMDVDDPHAHSLAEAEAPSRIPAAFAADGSAETV
jgi:1L-myo-inositol 1-phosphate cytidylyltransferase